MQYNSVDVLTMHDSAISAYRRTLCSPHTLTRSASTKTANIAHNRLLKLRAAIERASSRNKEVFIAFRGPHIIAVEWAENHSLGGDVQSLFYHELIKEVFRDLKDRVIFLDGWKMSIAIENTQVHPSDDIPRAMVNTLLSYIC